LLIDVALTAEPLTVISEKLFEFFYHKQEVGRNNLTVVRNRLLHKKGRGVDFDTPAFIFTAGGSFEEEPYRFFGAGFD
jgi:hypothetical protein